MIYLPRVQKVNKVNNNQVNYHHCLKVYGKFEPKIQFITLNLSDLGHHIKCIKVGRSTKGQQKLEWCWFLRQSAKTMSTPACDHRPR